MYQIYATLVFPSKQKELVRVHTHTSTLARTQLTTDRLDFSFSLVRADLQDVFDETIRVFVKEGMLDVCLPPDSTFVPRCFILFTDILVRWSPACAQRRSSSVLRWRTC
jgi:hypothetical protein